MLILIYTILKLGVIVLGHPVDTLLSLYVTELFQPITSENNSLFTSKHLFTDSLILKC